MYNIATLIITILHPNLKQTIKITQPIQGLYIKIYIYLPNVFLHKGLLQSPNLS